MRALRANVNIFGTILLLAAGGCVVLQSLGIFNTGLTFSHQKHVKGEGLECQNCHSKAATADLAGMPSKKKCMTCHEGGDEQKPPEKHVETLFKDGDTLQAKVTTLPVDVVFSHKTHVAKEIACAECHRGIEENTRVTEGIKVTMKACMACHAEKKVAADCATCHKEIRKDRPPASHQVAWKKLHGQEARAEEINGEHRCAMCHTESTCSQCHQNEPPENHTNQWRHQGHTVAAEMDRKQCATCHQSDSCDRCHSETAPRSHTGSWGRPRDNHCNTCHLPLRTEGCAVCHQTTPDHAATPKPAWHVSGMNCRMCHGQGQPLPHPDKGDNCNACHP